MQDYDEAKESATGIAAKRFSVPDPGRGAHSPSVSTTHLSSQPGSGTPASRPQAPASQTGNGKPSSEPSQVMNASGPSENGVSRSWEPPKANILLVDDRADKLLALEAILSSLGQNIVKARSGKEALRHLLNMDFATILLDVSMPCMDGFETSVLIRKRTHCVHTPIIFITSFSNSDNTISQGYSLGAVDYLLTPIVPEVLRTKVSVFVELYRKSELIKQQAEELRRMEENRHQRELA